LRNVCRGLSRCRARRSVARRRPAVRCTGRGAVRSRTRSVQSRAFRTDRPNLAALIPVGVAASAPAGVWALRREGLLGGDSRVPAATSMPATRSVTTMVPAISPCLARLAAAKPRGRPGHTRRRLRRTGSWKPSCAELKSPPSQKSCAVGGTPESAGSAPSASASTSASAGGPNGTSSSRGPSQSRGSRTTLSPGAFPLPCCVFSASVSVQSTRFADLFSRFGSCLSAAGGTIPLN
jgi:hypothetical protein